METINLFISEDFIIEKSLQLMELAEQFIDKSGIEKKEFVMTRLKQYIDNEAYNKYYYFINSFIDFTIKISKNKINLNLNNIKKKYCCF